MPLLYGLVAREVNILAEFTAHSGNFQQIIVGLLPKLQQNRRRSFNNGEYLQVTCYPA